MRRVLHPSLLIVLIFWMLVGLFVYITNSQLTPTQLLMRYWAFWAFGVVLAFSVMAVRSEF